jgi:hypothetical protein
VERKIVKSVKAKAETRRDPQKSAANTSAIKLATLSEKNLSFQK